MFRYIWLTALPDSVHQVLSADDGDLENLAVKATHMMKEAVVKKKRLERINAISSRDDLGEIDAVSSGAAKAKTGLVLYFFSFFYAMKFTPVGYEGKCLSLIHI